MLGTIQINRQTRHRPNQNETYENYELNGCKTKGYRDWEHGRDC